MARPPKAERDLLRRAEIVAAARTCVLLHGFHAASMAQIAEQAGKSVGQIYRYFPNKDAIVRAIVERIVSERLTWIASTHRLPDVSQELTRRMFASENAEDDALLLEVTSEATRNPAVAEIVRTANSRLQAQAVAIARSDHPHLGADEAVARVELVTALSLGTAFRRVTHQLHAPDKLAALYCEVIRALLAGGPSRLAPLAEAPPTPVSEPPAPAARGARRRPARP